MLRPGGLKLLGSSELVHNIYIVISSGFRFMRRYWSRLVCGVLLGVLYGLSNTALLGATKSLLDRVFPPTNTASAVASAPAAGTFSFRANLRKAGDFLTGQMDPWLPRAGRALDWRQAAGLLAILPLLFAFRGYAGFLSNYCMGWVSERVVHDLRQQVFYKLSTLSLDYFNRATMGDMITHVQGDTQALQKALNLGVGDLVKEPVTIVCTLAFMLWIDWELTLFAAAFLPICVIPMRVLGRKVRNASRKNTKTAVSQQSLLVEFLSSIRLVKAYKLEKEATERFAEHASASVHQRMKEIQAKELINPLIETIGAFGLSVSIIYILWRQKTGSDLALFVAAVVAIYSPVKKLAGVHMYFEQAVAGIERLTAILAQEPTVKDPERPRVMPAFSGEIRFENVTFGYGDRPILRDFNLVIPRGMKLGVAGESGSGKSTLVNLLYRFYDPQAGRITIDGQDIRELSTSDLRQQMALVSQEVVLFDQSVAENIACGKPGATQQEIEEAARDAFAHDFIMQTPEGYKTRVGDRGIMLSGGQRQRIAIARAFIRQAPILALDEATAALDAASEAQVQQAIDHLAEHRTVISVAHRLSTLAKMDRIILLSHGEIVEEGTFGELIGQRQRFGEMARTQGISKIWHASSAH